jgi:hypothetical protein
MTPTGAWDLDQWRVELEKHMQPQSMDVQSVSAVFISSGSLCNAGTFLPSYHSES